MKLHVTDVKYLEDYKIWVSFNNGKSGFVALMNELDGDVFGPLLDKEKFKRFSIDPIMETVKWENGADLAPEHLLSLLIEPIKKVG